LSKYALCFLIIPLHSIFASGWNDYGVELGAGYELLRTNSPTITIFKKNSGFVVPPKIVGLNIRKDIIVGKAEISSFADLPSVPGFFIVNMTTGSVQIGLDEQAWLNALRPLGFAKPPSLLKPSRFFMLKLFIHKWTKLAVIIFCIVSVLLVAYYLRGKLHREKTMESGAAEIPRNSL
jgi:hypothetical protein